MELLFKALSDEKRTTIISILLQSGQICVCDLADLVKLSQSKLSYHLKILLDAHLIQKEEIGTWNYYHVNQEALRNLLSEEAFQMIHQKWNDKGGVDMKENCCEKQVNEQPCCEENKQPCCEENKKECC